MKFRLSYLLLVMLPLYGYTQYIESEWEERDTWMPVQQMFELAEIKEGSHVADIGCHEGYLSVHLAKEVGSEGRVYAVDIKEDRLDLLRTHLLSRELDNVAVILGDYDDPKLPKGKLDVVVIMDTYHEMNDYESILEHVFEALKPGGRLLILEKLKKRVRNGTRSEQTDAHTIAAKYVKKEMKQANFTITKEIKDMGYWEKETDKTIWLLVAKKPSLGE